MVRTITTLLQTEDTGSFTIEELNHVEDLAQEAKTMSLDEMTPDHYWAVRLDIQLKEEFL